MESLETEIKEETPLRRKINFLQSLYDDPLYMEEKFKDKMDRIEKNTNVFDRDGDGYISLDEVIEILRSIDWELPLPDLEELFKEIQTPEGKIGTKQIFIFCIAKFEAENKEKEIQFAFELLDKEKTGILPDPEFFKELLMTKGLKMSEEEAEDVLDALNPKGGEQIDYKAFCKLITAPPKKSKKKKGKKK
jgi:Ca2+-binding EF-hand superfamily protein